MSIPKGQIPLDRVHRKRRVLYVLLRHLSCSLVQPLGCFRRGICVDDHDLCETLILDVDGLLLSKVDISDCQVSRDFLVRHFGLNDGGFEGVW